MAKEKNSCENSRTSAHPQGRTSLSDRVITMRVFMIKEVNGRNGRRVIHVPVVE
jgi:hypothetical protein